MTRRATLCAKTDDDFVNEDMKEDGRKHERPKYGSQSSLVADHKIGIVEVGWAKDQAVCGFGLEINAKTIIP